MNFYTIKLIWFDRATLCCRIEQVIFIVMRRLEARHVRGLKKSIHGHLVASSERLGGLTAITEHLSVRSARVQVADVQVLIHIRK